MLVLDTDHMTFLQWHATSNEGLRLIHRLEQCQHERSVTTIVTYEEHSRGWLAYVSKARTRLQQVDAYRKLAVHAKAYATTVLLDFDDAAARKFEELRNARLRVGTHDLKIAAITLVHDATLLSRNLKDFSKVPGLRVEDWTI